MDTPTREVYWNIGHQYLWVMYLLLAITVGTMAYAVYRYIRIFAPGKPADRFGDVGARLGAFFAHGVGQGRTLQRRYSGLSHAAFSFGFLILFAATTVVFIHEDLNLRIMQGGFYLWFQSLTVDIFGLLAIVGVLMAIAKRFAGGRGDRLYHPLDPRTLLDDGLILGGFLVILLTGYVLEGIRIVATNDPWGDWSPVGKAFGSVLQASGLGVTTLLGIHAFSWWFHLVLALAWIAYIPYSKLRHVVFSPANIYFRRLEPRGQLDYVDVEKAFEQDPPAVGVGKIEDLTWKDRLDTQACTECARCELACPASRTDKALSPFMLILDLRNQLLTQAGPPMARARRDRGDGADAPLDGERVEPNTDPVRESVSLVGDVITDAVLWDCTTCYACMEACPVFIEHVPKIVEMRRHLVMVENRFEPELQRLFDNLEAAGNPWRFPRTDRAKWADGLEVPILGQDVTVDEVDVLYWVGCFASYDERNQKIARALAGVLRSAGLRFAILGTQETCTGDPARRAGHEYLWQMLAGENVATLNELGVGDRKKTILASCPHCFNTLKDEYPQLGGHYVVRHHADYLAELVREGTLQPTVALDASVAYHDPCYLGRYQDIYDQPREVLGAIPGLELKEVSAGCRNKAMCCGAGGAKIFFEERRGTRINHLRMEQIQAEHPERVATACPYCMVMLEDGARAKGVYDELPILDISEYLQGSLVARTNGAAMDGTQ
ncbi:MAG: (Fe-S)-binding protein [Chloroflexi bacterium]|nr:(Fe-S)-binding protein [Chloroflexota bacterium]